MTEDIKEEKIEHINIRVQAQDNTEVFFKIKKNTPFSKLMNAYCEKLGKSTNAVSFLYDGVRIEPHNTPEELELEDNDTVDAVLKQVGGNIF